MSTVSTRREIINRLVAESGGRLMLGDDPRLVRERRDLHDVPTDSEVAGDAGSPDSVEPDHAG